MLKDTGAVASWFIRAQRVSHFSYTLPKNLVGLCHLMKWVRMNVGVMHQFLWCRVWHGYSFPFLFTSTVTESINLRIQISDRDHTWNLSFSDFVAHYSFPDIEHYLTMITSQKNVEWIEPLLLTKRIIEFLLILVMLYYFKIWNM